MKGAIAAAMLGSNVVEGRTYKMAMYTDYPPYAFGNESELKGFGPDIARGMNAMETGACSGKSFQLVLANWSQCWTSTNGGQIGEKLNNSEFDACMAYTHTKGVRNRDCEFGDPILADNKPAGLQNEKSGPSSAAQRQHQRNRGYSTHVRLMPKRLLALVGQVLHNCDARAWAWAISTRASSCQLVSRLAPHRRRR